MTNLLRSACRRELHSAGLICDEQTCRLLTKLLGKRRKTCDHSPETSPAPGNISITVQDTRILAILDTTQMHISSSGTINGKFRKITDFDAQRFPTMHRSRHISACQMPPLRACRYNFRRQIKCSAPNVLDQWLPQRDCQFIAKSYPGLQPAEALLCNKQRSTHRTDLQMRPGIPISRSVQRWCR